MKELRECPFCGSTVTLVSIHPDHWQVECDNEDCVLSTYSRTMEEVTERWNQRSSEAEVKEAA